jgi:Alpha/beta hydrolase domain
VLPRENVTTTAILGRRQFLLRASAAGLVAATGDGLCFAPDPPRHITFVQLPDPLEKGTLIWDCSAFGYRVEEYIVHGEGPTFAPMSPTEAGKNDHPDPSIPWSLRDREYAANLPSDFSSRPQTGVASYATRIIVYRPLDAKNMSGNVIVEAVHPAGGIGLWSVANRFFLRRGDVVVHIEAPGRLDLLKQQWPDRYGTLSMTDRSSFWTAISQIASSLKAGGSGSPLAMPARRMYFTGYSGSADYVYIFLSYHHRSTRTSDGSPVFDGYLPMSVLRPVPSLDAVIVTVATQNDMFGNASGELPAAHTFRKVFDSDSRESRRRRYEMPGPFHGEREPYGPGMAVPPRTPASSEVFASCAAKLRWPADAMPNEFPRHTLLEACFRHASRWVETGVAPPRAPLIETDADDKVLTDSNGNARGGLRFPELSVPSDAFVPVPRDGEISCRSIGYRVPFSREKMVALYGSREHYLSLYDSAADKLVTEGFIFSGDAQELKTARRWTAPVF